MINEMPMLRSEAPSLFKNPYARRHFAFHIFFISLFEGKKAIDEQIEGSDATRGLKDGVLSKKDLEDARENVGNVSMKNIKNDIKIAKKVLGIR